MLGFGPYKRLELYSPFTPEDAAKHLAIALFNNGEFHGTMEGGAFTFHLHRVQRGRYRNPTTILVKGAIAPSGGSSVINARMSGCFDFTTSDYLGLGLLLIMELGLSFRFHLHYNRSMLVLPGFLCFLIMIATFTFCFDTAKAKKFLIASFKSTEKEPRAA
jgi:hypothetical protein